MWAQFDPFAHDCLALWKRCRRGVGKTEAGSVVWEINYEALRAYLDTDGPLVAGHDPAEVLDGVLVVNGAKSAG